MIEGLDPEQAEYRRLTRIGRQHFIDQRLDLIGQGALGREELELRQLRDQRRHAAFERDQRLERLHGLIETSGIAVEREQRHPHLGVVGLGLGLGAQPGDACLEAGGIMDRRGGNRLRQRQVPARAFALIPVERARHHRHQQHGHQHAPAAGRLERGALQGFGVFQQAAFQLDPPFRQRRVIQLAARMAALQRGQSTPIDTHVLGAEAVVVLERLLIGMHATRVPQR